MPFLKVALPPPPTARPRRALGQFHREPWLKTYENGFPMTSAANLGEYKAAPWMQNYVNGHPMEAVPGADGSVPKAALVKMALRISMQKKRNGSLRCAMRGLGDGSGDFGINVSDPGVITDPNTGEILGVPSSDKTYDPTTGVTYDPSTGIAVGPNSSTPGGYPIVLPAGGGVFNPATGQITPAQSGLTQSISSLASGLARAFGVGSPTPYYSTPSSLSAGLNQPLYAGSSMTTGSALLIFGGVAAGLILFSAVAKKK